MNASVVIDALQARWIREDVFVFRCPLHQSKSRSSGRGRVLADRILIKDFGGCTTIDILSAVGLTWRDLYDGSDDATFSRPELDRRRRILRGFHRWREQALQATAADLRQRDAAGVAIQEAVQRGAISEDAAWTDLENIFTGYSELEHRFEVLRTGSDSEALGIYRNG
jgi:hypothetical protein